jgi:hypothetical protein
MYHNCFSGPDGDPYREAAIFRNTVTKEFIIFQGDAGSVGVGHPQWKEILDGPDVGRWEVMAHSHPAVRATGVVDPAGMLPSGLKADMQKIYDDARRSGSGTFSSRIHFTTPDGPNYTDFGYDRKNPARYWVDLPDGPVDRLVIRFDSLREYDAFWRKAWTTPRKELPELYRRAAAESDAKAASRAAKRVDATTVPHPEDAITSVGEPAAKAPSDLAGRPARVFGPPMPDRHAPPGGRRSRHPAYATTVPQADATTMPHPADATTVPHPAYATTVPHAGATTMPHPADATTVPHPAYATTVPQADATTMPQADATTVPHPADATTVPHPAYASTVPQADATTVRPADAMTVDATTVSRPADATTVDPTTVSRPADAITVKGDPVMGVASPTNMGYSKYSNEGISDAERALLDRTVASLKDLDPGVKHVNEAYKASFTDDTQGIFKPQRGEQSVRTTIPTGEIAYREVAASRLDEVFGFDLVPTTTLREGGSPAHGLGSMQEYVPSTQSLPVGSYAQVEQERMAVLDYVTGNTDRHMGNYLTGKDGRLVAIDHGFAFPTGEAHPIRSDFVSAYLNRSLSPKVIKAVRAVDPQRVVDVLRASGLKDDAIEGALRRLQEVRANGKITGKAWDGAIADAANRIRKAGI